ncbi:hypothetical protein ACWF82_20995 [Nocardia sp. NPDC055053]
MRRSCWVNSTAVDPERLGEIDDNQRVQFDLTESRRIRRRSALS